MLRPSIKRRIIGIATGMIILAVITSVMSMVLASRVGHLLDELMTLAQQCAEIDIGVRVDTRPRGREAGATHVMANHMPGLPGHGAWHGANRRRPAIFIDDKMGSH